MPEIKRILITGMSGTGKSSVLEELQARGFLTVDTDYNDWCELVVSNGEAEWIWREERMLELLSQPLETSLFVQGCCSNQSKFYRYFDYKILLSAPLEIVLDRVNKRSTNPYGKSEAQRAEIAQNFGWVQPLLRRSADFEIDTSAQSVREVADFLVGLTCEEGS